MITVRLTFTYECVTDESAREGDVSDHGFYAPGGHFDSICGDNREVILQDARNGEYDQHLRACEALRAIEWHVGGGEVDAHGDTLRVYAYDAGVDYATGEETRITAHVKAHPRLIAAMARKLRSK